ncbi:hypothetical protein [Paenibacillus lignilyticus]|uniref:Uncharacterized protein n=1 Tax=Paenibacillus lignilyticus TaxID=1172615 RepID=A0ABS5CNI4_9BACL|nr:hypothetical protein [Paenibacillus lignilyticus]MBP3967405.1 hypothetical protein [Paenibacillus lignilyticus]
MRVVINGGTFFPWVTQVYNVRHFPNMTLAQALAGTGVVRFGNNGRIISVNGVATVGSVDTILRLNGRRIPESLLYLPVQFNDTVGLELTVSPFGGPRGDDEHFGLHPDQIENNYEQLKLLEENNQG